MTQEFWCKSLSSMWQDMIFTIYTQAACRCIIWQVARSLESRRNGRLLARLALDRATRVELRPGLICLTHNNLENPMLTFQSLSCRCSMLFLKEPCMDLRRWDVCIVLLSQRVVELPLAIWTDFQYPVNITAMLTLHQHLSLIGCALWNELRGDCCSVHPSTPPPFCESSCASLPFLGSLLWHCLSRWGAPQKVCKRLDPRHPGVGQEQPWRAFLDLESIFQVCLASPSWNTSRAMHTGWQARHQGHTPPMLKLQASILFQVQDPTENMHVFLLGAASLSYKINCPLDLYALWSIGNPGWGTTWPREEGSKTCQLLWRSTSASMPWKPCRPSALQTRLICNPG